MSKQVMNEDYTVPTKEETEGGDMDPLLLAAYIIFGLAAIMLLAAIARLVYWYKFGREKRQWLGGSSADSTTNSYCSRGIKSRPNAVMSDDDSLKISMEDFYHRPIDSRTEVKVTSKGRIRVKERVPTDPTSRPEEFWKLKDGVVPEKKLGVVKPRGSESSDPGSRLMPVDETPEREAEDLQRNSVPDVVAVSAVAAAVIDNQATEEKAEPDHSGNTDRNEEEAQPETFETEAEISPSGSLVTQEDVDEEEAAADDTQEEQEQDTREDETSATDDEAISEPEPEEDLTPEARGIISEGKHTMTLDDIRSESMSVGSFIALKASWKMKEAQVESGFTAPMGSPLGVVDPFIPNDDTMSRDSLQRENIPSGIVRQRLAGDTDSGFISNIMKDKQMKIDHEQKMAGRDEDTIYSTARIYAKKAGMSNVDTVVLEGQNIRESPPLTNGYGSDVTPTESSSLNNSDSLNVSDNYTTNTMDSMATDASTITREKRLRFSDAVEHIHDGSSSEDMTASSSDKGGKGSNPELSYLAGHESVMMPENDVIAPPTDENSNEISPPDSHESLSDRPPTPVPSRRNNNVVQPGQAETVQI